jgi:glycosyltransferase involved in cell wall biosynthesis
MTSSKPAKVTIGMPVYNGERFLGEVLGAITGQTFTDLEVIISDNASTDGTEEICRRFAASDARVRYVRQEHNLGAAPNYNVLLDHARGRYFKWAADDDLVTPHFVERCAAVLDEDPSVVVAFGDWCYVDEQSERIAFEDVPEYDGPPGLYTDLMVNDPVARFRALVTGTRQPVPPIFGLMRTDALRRTTLHQSFFGSDRLLLVELGLLGRYHQVPELLFLHRRHARQSYLLSPRDREAWISGRRPGFLVFPQWGLFRGYLRAALRIPGLSVGQRLRCLMVVIGYTLRPRQLRRLIVPGADNYLGIGSRRST